MSNPIASILRASIRKDNEPLNILTFPTHERYQTALSKTGHNFYLLQGPGIKTWNSIYAPLPHNHTLLNPNRQELQIPPDLDFDLIISQNKHAHFNMSKKLSDILHIPLISLEHCLPAPDWPKQQIEYLKTLRGHTNIFISEFSRNKWGWGADEASVIHHGIDTNLFKPNDLLVTKKNHVLSVVNQLRERDWCCGYNFWEEATKDLPRLHIGESPDGWSQPAKSVPDLIMKYRECAVFVDTASASPIPSVVLEAMACGCIVVSRGNAMVPEIIRDGVNGFICETASDMKSKLREILLNPSKYEDIRKMARNTIIEKFSLDKFIKTWDNVLRNTANIVYTGGI